jgi:hypothetical protein
VAGVPQNGHVQAGDYSMDQMDDDQRAGMEQQPLVEACVWSWSSWVALSLDGWQGW